MKIKRTLIVVVVGVGGGCGSLESEDELPSTTQAALVQAATDAISTATAATAASAQLDSAVAPLPTYDLQIIGPLQGSVVNVETAVAINARGAVAGTAGGDAAQVAFRYQDCRVTVLPTLPGAQPATTQMKASDINDDGIVVGTALAATSPIYRAFQSDGSVTTDLDPAGTQIESGYAVGPAGIALGVRSDPGGSPALETAVYFLFGKAYPLDLFTAPTGQVLRVNSFAQGCRGGIRCGLHMNRSFNVVGGAGSFGVVSGGGFTGWSQVHGTGYANETDVLPEDINDSGHIVGSIGLSGTTRHAFVTYNPAGKARDLGVLHGGTNSYANAINDSDDVVGAVAMSSGVPSRAVIWHNGAIADLNTRVVNLGSYVLKDAKDINDHGWIVGTAFLPFQGSTTVGWNRAYVLIPRGTAPYSCP